MGTFLLLLTLWTDSTSSSQDSHMYITQNTGYTSISPFVGILLQCWLLAVHWGRYHWNGGIYQGYSNVLLLFLCVLYVQIFFMVAHATLQVSDSVIHHCKMPVCAWLLFLLIKTLFFQKFVSFRSVRRSASLRSECLRYITYIHFFQDCRASLKRKWKDPLVYLSVSMRISSREPIKQCRALYLLTTAPGSRLSAGEVVEHRCDL